MLPVKESKEATRRLVQFSVKTSYQDLPPEAIHATKRMVLDSIGVALVGSLLPKGQYVIETMQEISGTSQATIISSRTKVPVHNAAFANAELLNTMEMDPVFWNFAHIATFIFPTILSLAEYAQVRGTDLITALALGFDVSARIGRSLSPLAYLKGDPKDVSKMEVGSPENYGYGWNMFGCVAGGGKLLGLDEEHMANAFGLAGYTAPVPFVIRALSLPPASMVRYTVAGWHCQNAVVSVLLAKKGYTADKEVLDGPLGFWKFWGSIQWDTDTLFDALGEKWWITCQTYKFWPICSLMNTQITLTKKLVEENNLKPEEIEAIDFFGHPLCGATPLYTTDKVEDEWGAMLNTRYGMAMAVFGLEPLDWVLKRPWEDEKVRSLMKKVSAQVHPQVKEFIPQKATTDPYRQGIYRWPCEIVIKARGKEFRAYGEYFKGHDAIEDSRLSDDELKEKFLSNALHVLSEDKCNRIIDTVMHLEKLDNVKTLAEHLRP